MLLHALAMLPVQHLAFFTLQITKTITMLHVQFEVSETFLRTRAIADVLIEVEVLRTKLMLVGTHARTRMLIQDLRFWTIVLSTLARARIFVEIEVFLACLRLADARAG